MQKYSYTYRGTERYCYLCINVLKNKLNIKDDEVLLIAEREITSIKLSMFYNMPLLNKFDMDSLCKIHKLIFEDIYQWAGQIRQGDFLAKGNSIFCRGQYIIESANKKMKNLNIENRLCGLEK